MTRRSRKIRVLLILHELSLSGAPSTALEIFEGLRQETNVFTLALNEGPQRKRAEALGPVFSLSNPADNFCARQLRRFARFALAPILHFWLPDVIYINSLLGLELASLVRLPSSPVVLHVHEIGGVLRWHARRHQDRFLRWPTRYFVPTEKVAEQLGADYKIPDAKIHVIRPFISEELFASTADTSDLDDQFIVGGAGGPVWAKGVLLWLQVAHELREIFGDEKAKFVWVGTRNDQESAEFRQMTSSLGLDSVVTFIEETPNWLDHFRRFNAFAMTSWEESASRVTLYSMMLSKPVVCFANSGGPEELLGDSGLIIPGFSPRRMAEGLADLARSPDRSLRLGRAGRARVAQKHMRNGELEKVLTELSTLTRT